MDREHSHQSLMIFVATLVFLASCSDSSSPKFHPQPPHDVGASDSLYYDDPLMTAGEHIFFLNKKIKESYQRLDGIMARSIETDDDPVAISKAFRVESDRLEKIVENFRFWSDEYHRQELKRETRIAK